MNDFENFITKVHQTLETKTLKAQASGRSKANFEMKVYWLEPRGAKFTFRSDDTHENLTKKMNLKAKNEIQALQIKFAAEKNKIKSATIYDNSVEYGKDNILFMYKNGAVLINRIAWN